MWEKNNPQQLTKPKLVDKMKQSYDSEVQNLKKDNDKLIENHKIELEKKKIKMINCVLFV